MLSVIILSSVKNVLFFLLTQKLSSCEQPGQQLDVGISYNVHPYEGTA
jgi:hypothetical protein